MPKIKCFLIVLILGMAILMETMGWTADFSIKEAELLNQEVNRFCKQGQYEDAIPLAERILAICEKSLGPEHPQTALALSKLAEIYSAMGDYDEAEPLYRRSLAIQEKSLGPHHPDTVTTLHSLYLLQQMIHGSD